MDEPEPKDDEERVSLAGLNPLEALRGLLQVAPDEDLKDEQGHSEGETRP